MGRKLVGQVSYWINEETRRRKEEGKEEREIYIVGGVVRTPGARSHTFYGRKALETSAEIPDYR